MSRDDPMKPFYERNKPALGGGEPPDEIAIIVREILRFIKQMNPSSMFTWSEEDTNDAIQLCKDLGFTAPMLSLSFTRLRKQATKQKIDFDAFYKIAADIKEHWEDCNPKHNSYSNELDWREKERLLNQQHQERLANAPKSGSSAIKKYWMDIIKSDLQKAGVKPNSGLGKIVANL